MILKIFNVDSSVGELILLSFIISHGLAKCFHEAYWIFVVVFLFVG